MARRPIREGESAGGAPVGVGRVRTTGPATQVAMCVHGVPLLRAPVARVLRIPLEAVA